MALNILYFVLYIYEHYDYKIKVSVNSKPLEKLYDLQY